MKLSRCCLVAAGTLVVGICAAHATPFTNTSPTGGILPAAVSAVGGIVVDLIGANGTRVVSQVAASTEFVGQPDSSVYPLLFGTQGGITPTLVSALGGGISSASFRITLYDGDNQIGDFDYNLNDLLVNNIDFGNFSNVTTQQTDSSGTAVISSGLGFGNDILGTGFFSSNNASMLALLYTSLSMGSIEFRVADQTPGDQYYDFSQGLDASVINVGSGPVITPGGGGGGTTTAMPEPASLLLLGAGLASASILRRNRSETTSRLLV